MLKIIQILLNLIPFSLRGKIQKIQGVKQFQRFLMDSFMRDKEFVACISGGPAQGLKMKFKMPADKLMWTGTYELAFSQMLASRIQRGMTCYDLGGYKGYYSGVMALQGAAKVFVFEPMPENIESIEQMIKMNAHLPIQLIKSAVSSTNGKLQFLKMPDKTMGKLEQSAFQKEVASHHAIEVDSVTLDSFVAQGYPVPKFIKMDVEGAEEYALSGAMKLLSEHKPVLMIEVHSVDIGKRCLLLLNKIYKNMMVLETGKHPDEGFPEVSHFIAS